MNEPMKCGECIFWQPMDETWKEHCPIVEGYELVDHKAPNTPCTCNEARCARLAEQLGMLKKGDRIIVANPRCTYWNKTGVVAEVRIIATVKMNIEPRIGESEHYSRFDISDLQIIVPKENPDE
jgi:hypothetical protein